MPRRSSRNPAPKKEPPDQPKPEKRAAKRKTKSPPVAAAPKKRKREPDKRIYVNSVRQKDVLKGRGPAVNGHKGNVEFRKLAATYIARYTEADKPGKTQICQEIVDICTSKDIYFLEKDGTNHQWFHVTEHTARTKAGQTIQDMLKKRDKDEVDQDNEEEEEVGTSGIYSEGDGSHGSHSLPEDEEDQESDDVQTDLKLPVLPAASAGLGTQAEDLASGMAATVFAAADENSDEHMEGSSPNSQRPEAQLRPAPFPYYLRQLSTEHTNHTERGYDSLHDSEESS